MTRKEKCAYLFDEIGRVDDRFLAEALQPAKATSKRPRYVMLLAACLSMALILLTVGAVILSRDDPSGPPSIDQDGALTPDENGTLSNEGDDATAKSDWQLDNALLDLRAELADGVSFTEEEFDFFAGQTRIVWQYADEPERFWASRPLTEGEYQKLISESRRSSTRRTSEEPLCRIWIAEADGEVWTPYLKSSSGNISAAEFFDYSAEVAPSEEWILCASDILS